MSAFERIFFVKTHDSSGTKDSGSLAECLEVTSVTAQSKGLPIRSLAPLPDPCLERQYTSPLTDTSSPAPSRLFTWHVLGMLVVACYLVHKHLHIHITSGHRQ